MEERPYTLQEKRYYLAKHYLERLTAASAAYRRGHENTSYALALFDQEWPQIKQWWHWANLHAPQNDQIARLSVEYMQQGTELFYLRQTPQERLEWLQNALLAARKIQDLYTEVVCLFHMAWAIHKQADLEQAESMARKALALGQTNQNLLCVGRILHLLGEIVMRRGDYAEALDLCTRSLDILLTLEATTYLPDLYITISEIRYMQGDLAKARDYALRSVTILEAGGVEVGFANIYNWFGSLAWEAGEFDLGEKYVLKSVEASRKRGAQSTLAHGLYSLGTLEVTRQCYPDAQRYFNESLQVAKSIGEAWLIPIVEAEQGYLCYLMGNHQTADQTLNLTIEFARHTGYRGVLALTLNYLADIQISGTNPHHAIPALSEGLGIALADKNRIEMMHGLLVAAKFSQRVGKFEQAAQWLGLLLSQPSIIAPILSPAMRLYRALEHEMGKVRFHEAVQGGKSLNPELVIETIVKEQNTFPKIEI